MPTTRHLPSMQVVDCREHGDHCFGLIGLISTFGLLGRTATLHVYAPAQLEPMLKAQLDMFFNYDIGYKVEFHAIDTTKQQVIFEDRSLTVESIPLDHRMPCAGFLFREKPLSPHIRRDMIEMYDIPVSQINNIKAGQGYTLSDGTYVPNEQLVTPADKPRSYADDKEDGAAKYFHSTARQAATVARDAGVGKLLLGHFSARYVDETILLNEAKEVFENTFLTAETMVFDI